MYPRSIGLMNSLLLLFGLVLLLRSITAQRLSEYKCQEFFKKNTLNLWGAPLTHDSEPVQFWAPNCSDNVGTSDDWIRHHHAREANEGEFPHQAALGYVTNATDQNIGGYWFKCGGSLISEWFVLTAAHCGTPKVVRLGVDNLNVLEDGDLFEVDKFYKHPNWSIRASYDDIALVKTKQEVSFSFRIQPACLWTNKALNVSTVVATGFLTMDYDFSERFKHLMKVHLNVQDKEQCFKKYKNQRKFKLGIQDGQLCAGSRVYGMNDCFGDSGGPLQTVTDAKTCMYHIIGVTFMSSCGNVNVYTQVASYLDWIEDTVWPGHRSLYEIEGDDY